VSLIYQKELRNEARNGAYRPNSKVNSQIAIEGLSLEQFSDRAIITNRKTHNSNGTARKWLKIGRWQEDTATYEKNEIIERAILNEGRTKLGYARALANRD